MNFPSGHLPRYSHFTIDSVLDETLREGSERCMFSISNDDKLPLIRSIVKSGIKDLIFGSGPNDPADLAAILAKLDVEGELLDQRFSFILLLNCFEPLMTQFEQFPEQLKKYVTISFGMITHDSDRLLFEKTVDVFRRMGFDSYRVSLLNNFSGDIDEKTYESICRQINRTRSIGIETIRINDSLGTIYPEAMAVLAANLRYDYPITNFCLHAHDDKGLGLQNALASIYHGFNMIEGGFAEFGNRSGLPAIELLAQIFVEKNIAVNNGPLNSNSLFSTARMAEETFLATPSLFRPVSGYAVNCENMGVTNIPDYLGASSASRYFLNRIGLHTSTVERIFRDLGVDDDELVVDTASRFKALLEDMMRETTVRKTFEYTSLRHMIHRFYDNDVLFSEKVYELAREFLNEHCRDFIAA